MQCRSSKPFRSSLLSYCGSPTCSSQSPTGWSSSRPAAPADRGKRFRREKPFSRQQRHSEDETWHCHIILGQQSRAHQQQEGGGDSVLCGQGVSSRRAAGAEPQSPKMDWSAPDLRGEAEAKKGYELVDDQLISTKFLTMIARKIPKNTSSTRSCLF